MIDLGFSSHLQVINKVYEQRSANWYIIHYSIETILPYYVIKKSLLLVIVQQCIWFISQLKARNKIQIKVAYTLAVFEY